MLVSERWRLSLRLVTMISQIKGILSCYQIVLFVGVLFIHTDYPSGKQMWLIFMSLT